ncbi:MAG: hypothetical protein GX493_03960 [Firmicutes bacterium]|nr:hypothetical protein [Bacillota bacterium]
MTSLAAPLYEALCAYVDKSPVGFHTPGHTGGRAYPLSSLWTLDLTELFLGPTGPYLPSVVTEAERLAAEAFGAGRSFFLTNGASIGVLAMVLGSAPPGGTIFIGRDCHRAVVHACILGDLRPVFLPPLFADGWEFPMGVALSELKKVFCRKDLILVTNPTYQGIVQDLKSIGEPEGVFLVDEAHGTHLALLENYAGAGVAGARAWVHGSHKTLGSLTQTGMLHLRRGVEEEPYLTWLERLGTTSPSYPLLASLDLARRWAVPQGREAWTRHAERMALLRRRLRALGWRVLTEEGLPFSAALDPAKLTVAVPAGGATLARKLLEDYGLQAEAVGPDWSVFLLTPFHTEEEIARLCKALADLVPLAVQGGSSPPVWPRRWPERVLWPREAALGPRRRVPLAEAEGLVAAEPLSPYPPGIPLVWPGEIIDQASYTYLLAFYRAGGHISGLDAAGRVAVVAI